MDKQGKTRVAGGCMFLALLLIVVIETTALIAGNGSQPKTDCMRLRKAVTTLDDAVSKQSFYMAALAMMSAGLNAAEIKEVTAQLDTGMLLAVASGADGGLVLKAHKAAMNARGAIFKAARCEELAVAPARDR